MERFYYNMFVMLMSLFMCMSGVLLTALAYRPKEIAEEWWEWTERFYKSETSRIVGPVLIILSLLLHVSSIIYCIVKRVKKRRLKEEVDSAEIRSMDIDPELLETKCLIDYDKSHDIACFPDGSLRCSRSRLRTGSESVADKTVTDVVQISEH